MTENHATENHATDFLTPEQEWLNQTPEHQCSKYFLQMEMHDGECVQVISLERSEYEALKARLAQKRGLAGGEGGPAGVQAVKKPELETLAKTITQKRALQRMESILQDIENEFRSVCENDTQYPDDSKQFLAEVELLAMIASDWNGRNFRGKHPGELDLISAIKENLGL